MKILPVLLFLFQNLIIHIPIKYINEIQGMLNRFLWKDRKPWVKMKLLHQKVIEGGIAYPPIHKYYQASRLAALMLWWKDNEMDIWVFEQYGITEPLKEWALRDPEIRSKAVKSNSTIHNAIMRNWMNCQTMLAPGQSPLASFLHHPGFAVTGMGADFHRWEKADLDQLGKLGTRTGMNTEAQVIKSLGNFQILRSNI